MQVNQVRAGAILSYVSMAVSTILSLVYAPIMKGQLGTSEYGVYGSVGPIIAYLLLLSMGLGSAYMRYYSQAKVAQDRRTMAKLNGMFLVTYTVLGLVLLVLGFTLAAHPQNVFGAKWTEEELALGAELLRIMSVNAALSFPISVFESNVNINERYLFLKLVAMAKSVLSPMISIPLLLLGYHSPAIAILSLMLTIVSGVVEAFYCLIRLRMPISFRGYDFALMKSMMGFTFYVFIAVVVDQVNYGIGTLMTTWIHGTELSAVYYNANQLNVYYLSFAMAISNVLAPRVHRMVASNTPTRELGRLMTRAGRLQFIMLMCVFLGFVAVGRPFVVLWAKGDASFAIVVVFPTPVFPTKNTTFGFFSPAVNGWISPSFRTIFWYTFASMLSIGCLSSFTVSSSMISFACASETSLSINCLITRSTTLLPDCSGSVFFSSAFTVASPEEIA